MRRSPAKASSRPGPVASPFNATKTGTARPATVHAGFSGGGTPYIYRKDGSVGGQNHQPETVVLRDETASFAQGVRHLPVDPVAVIRPVQGDGRDIGIQ